MLPHCINEIQYGCTILGKYYKLQLNFNSILQKILHNVMHVWQGKWLTEKLVWNKQLILPNLG